jgi:hypothetical protein
MQEIANRPKVRCFLAEQLGGGGSVQRKPTVFQVSHVGLPLTGQRFLNKEGCAELSDGAGNPGSGHFLILEPVSA